jgi:hypothetical protein
VRVTDLGGGKGFEVFHDPSAPSLSCQCSRQVEPETDTAKRTTVSLSTACRCIHRFKRTDA